MKKFEICVDDGGNVLPEFVLEQNESSVELYEWQHAAIKYFSQHNKVIFEVTTGAGKTFCAIELIKNIWAKDPDIKILIVVPKNVILESTWYKELYDNGISLKDIGVYYGAIKEISRITITNMQNLENIPMEIFDACIYDECHNYGTKRLMKFVNYPFKYKIGLSATIERMDDKHYDLMEAFNYNIFKYTPKQALSDGVLNPFDFINIGVELDKENFDEYMKLTEELNFIMSSGGGYSKLMRTDSGLKYKMLSKMNERKKMVSNYPDKFDVIKILCDKHRNDKVIVFNSFNEQTNKCYWHLMDVGMKACIVHSGIEKDKREDNMIGFKRGKYNIMLTSKVLDEVYNLPSIDVGIIMAGDSTSKQTIQRMGRVLRKKANKSTLYQIYCLNTIEDEHAIKRAKIFKSLCSDYKEYIFKDGELIE